MGLGKSPEKLICQTYDGASVMSSQKGGVQCLVKKKYPNAHFIHCYAHQGNLVLQNATSSSSQSRIFFQDLQGIGPFFSRSAKRMGYLVQMVQKKIGSVPPTRWYFQHRAVNTVFEHKGNLIKYFEHIRDTEVNDKNASCQVAGFVRTLKDPQFVFWLTFFHKIMPHVAIFFDCIQQRNIYAIKIRDFVKHFVNAVANIRKICEKTEESINEPINKRQCIEHVSSSGGSSSSSSNRSNLVAALEVRYALLL